MNFNVKIKIVIFIPSNINKLTKPVGDIVFNLVDFQLLKKTDQDNREDFGGGYTFEEAFRKPFLPKDRSETFASSSSETDGES